MASFHIILSFTSGGSGQIQRDDSGKLCQARVQMSNGFYCIVLGERALNTALIEFFDCYIKSGIHFVDKVLS